MRTAWPFCHAVCVNSEFSLSYRCPAISKRHLNALIVNCRSRKCKEAFILTPPTASQPLPEEQCGLGWKSRTMRKFILQRGCGCEFGQTFPAPAGSCASRLWTWGALGVRRSVACLSVEKLFCTNELYASCLGTSFWKQQLDATQILWSKLMLGMTF